MERAKPVRKSHSNTSDLLTWSEPSPTSAPPAVRSRQPSDGIRKVVFGGQVTDEEQQSLIIRKPCSGYKMKEMTGSGIFVAAGDASCNPSKTSVRMVRQASNNGISQISFSAEANVAPVKKPSSIPEAPKQRELSGTLKSEWSGTTKLVKRQASDAKCKELSGHDIFSPPPPIPPRSSLSAPRSLDSNQLKNVDQPVPRNVPTSVKVSIPAGGQSNNVFSEGAVVKTSRKINRQKLEDLTGNNIFKGDGAPGSVEKPLSQAKLREMSGSNIFSDDGGKVATRDYFRGVRKPPGGDTTITLI